MRKIKLGQIGLGHNHGEAKMLAARKFPECFEIVGFAEENEKWVENRGGLAGYAGLKRYTVAELIARCDALLIETEVQDLHRYAKLCIDAGKHIHLDKPWGGSLPEYKALLGSAERQRLAVQLGYMYRYNPAVQKCLAYIKSGQIGEIHSIECAMSTLHPKAYKEWLAHFSGGIMYILGCHFVDLIVYLLGEPKRVTSFLGQSGFDKVSFPDNCLAVLEYDTALCRIFTSSLEVNGFGRRSFTVAGRDATVDICPLERPCKMTYSDREIAVNRYENYCRTESVPDLPSSARYDEMMRDFYAYCVGEKQNPFSYRHDYTVQKVLEQIVGEVKYRE